MSLLLRKRDIARAVLGELTPGAEARLYDHLRACAPCRARYDQLANAKSFLDGRAATHARAHARLVAALDGLREGNAAPDRRRRPRWLPALFVLAPAAAILLWIAKPAAPPFKAVEDVTARGGPGSATSPAPPTLVIYASRKTGPTAHGPVRLVAELPGSGEARVSLADYLQLGVRGLPGVAHVRVVGIDARGALHDYLPDTVAAPAPGAATLGRSVELARDHAPGRVKVFALFSEQAVDDRAVKDAVAGRGTGAVTGVLVIEP
jgi:hypothetical protein